MLNLMCLPWSVYIWVMQAHQNSQTNTDSIRFITLHIRAVKGHPQGDHEILDDVSKTKDGTWVQKHAYCLLWWLMIYRGRIRCVAHGTKGMKILAFFVNNYRQHLIHICFVWRHRSYFCITGTVPVPGQSLFRFVSWFINIRILWIRLLLRSMFYNIRVYYAKLLIMFNP
jgi:hypothetical protein